MMDQSLAVGIALGSALSQSEVENYQRARKNEIPVATMTIQEFAARHDLPVNARGVIKGPGGFIYQMRDNPFQYLWRVLVTGLPNRNPLVCQLAGIVSWAFTFGPGEGKDGEYYALRMIGLEEGENSINRLQQFEWCFEFELTQALNVLCTHQKCIVCGTHKRGDEFGTYGSSRLKALLQRVRCNQRSLGGCLVHRVARWGRGHLHIEVLLD